MRWPEKYSDIDLESDFVILDSSGSVEGPFNEVKDPSVVDVLAILNGKTITDQEGALSALECYILRMTEELLLDPLLDPNQYDMVQELKDRLENSLKEGKLLNNEFRPKGTKINDALIDAIGLGQAETVHDFLGILKSNPKLYASAPPLENNSCFKDQRKIQLIRDIERDLFDVDGKILQGSAGFSSIRDHLTARFYQENKKTFFWRDDLSADVAKEFAETVLRVVNRTESGGRSFEAIIAILKSNEKIEKQLLLVPASTAAGPLKISISAGSMKDRSLPPGKNKCLTSMGLFAKIEATTAYDFYEESDIENPLLRVTATYRNSLSMSLSPTSAFSSKNSRGFFDNSGRATVELSFSDSLLSSFEAL
mmetsp:Transcript_19409/g.28748  ORF Transcript_19409/g.28748 Transcript_19409/m.28748 type:complete len:367 (+) Transcript_19409:69-1169(+)|eukprot:CAMPEP_0171457940 /NCGR_PEP_ID=MMETSP0945-20130129/3811_1 /TAXON_ID=109269 /ORGANISM="Vaucheria litorea, Strain CCMP2940" /LENGTH=366 /DNA_ID=CAMNT_0011983635 /DNA_START=68 /DNA_END=1168 /DNA_ORIENTATION=+